MVLHISLFIVAWILLFLINIQMYKLYRRRENFFYPSVLFCFLHIVGTLLLLILLIDTYNVFSKILNYFKK